MDQRDSNQQRRFEPLESNKEEVVQRTSTGPKDNTKQNKEKGEAPANSKGTDCKVHLEVW